ncbi:NAD regulator [uncultured Brevundimonas sp.]|uniref:NUDIX hydrolase n=1 Tax=uncultured Brevundimonas sp. TaxID=213418 RepID=UPI0030EE6A62|tara:strand:- start:50538 stop:51476 length:939 start_codon:yes stop_codon:yes gene_type:complete
MPVGEQGVRISLSAVVIALRDRQACVLTTESEDGATALPFGPFAPARDRTFELALRAFVTAQTGFHLGFVEQLYTFGDAGRDSPRATPGPDHRREISIGYLALTADATAAPAADARWTPVLDFFPWEDRRQGCPAAADTLIAGLRAWAGDDARRLARSERLFALTPAHRWNEGRVLERYELLYEAGLVAEAARDQERPAPPLAPGRAMVSDHRRILATGLGRLRSKLKYRPVLFDLMPPLFTLSGLQTAAEAIAGLTLHKQNFRRGVERTGLVEATGRLSTGTGGRPAELFRVSSAEAQGGEAMGLPLPAQR